MSLDKVMTITISHPAISIHIISITVVEAKSIIY